MSNKTKQYTFETKHRQLVSKMFIRKFELMDQIKSCLEIQMHTKLVCGVPRYTSFIFLSLIMCVTTNW